MNGKLLELLTTTVLIAVAFALSWIIAASYVPALVSWASQETQVIVILALLVLALALVSVVALRHTGQGDLP
jgi:hypothetical protein